MSNLKLFINAIMEVITIIMVIIEELIMAKGSIVIITIMAIVITTTIAIATIIKEAFNATIIINEHLCFT